MSSSLLTLSLHPAGRFSAQSRVTHATELNGTDLSARSQLGEAYPVHIEMGRSLLWPLMIRKRRQRTHAHSCWCTEVATMGPAGSRLSNNLEQLGHTAYGPTVAGHGKDVPKNVTHAESTQSIVDFIVGGDLTDFVLVGHSYAGTLISKVVEVIPERVRRLLFWSAYVLNTARARSKCCRTVFRCSGRWRPTRPTTRS